MSGTGESEVKAAAAAPTEAPTRVMMAVNESTIKGYPHASISSNGAFEWTLNKIIRSNFSGFKLLFLHVQVPDEDGLSSLTLSPLSLSSSLFPFSPLSDLSHVSLLCPLSTYFCVVMNFIHDINDKLCLLDTTLISCYDWSVRLYLLLVN